MTMADYPYASYSNTPKWKYDTKKNTGLNGYGHWEGVNVYMDEGNCLFQARKSRPALQFDRTNSIDLSPMCKPFALVSHEQSKYKDKGTEKNHPSTKLQKIINKGSGASALPIGHSFLHFLDKYPSVFTGSFQEFLKENKREHSLRSWMDRKMKTKLPMNYFLSHFDPLSFGPSKKLLSEYLQESQLMELKDELNDNGCAGQGCLVFKDLHKTRNENLGILIAASGRGLDELNLRLIYRNSNHFEESRKCPIEFQIMGEVSQTLNGRIVELSASEYDDSAILFVTTSDHHAVFNTIHKDNIVMDWESKELSFPEELSCSPCVLKSSGCSPFSSVVLNPYLPGECVVTTKDRRIGLWKADVRTSTNFSSDIFSKLHINFDVGESARMKQVCFGAHPRQFCSCDDSRLFLFDTRALSNTVCLFDVKSSLYTSKSEKIHAVQSCHDMSNEYEVLVATDESLLLFDIRHSKEPLLQWGSTCVFPTSYLKPVSCRLEKSYVTSPRTEWHCANSVILTGGRTTRHVQCHQLNRVTNISNKQKPLLFPPQYISAPRILNSYENIPDSVGINLKIQSHLYTASTSCNVIGFDATSVQLGDSEGICVFQLTAGGDISYQILSQTCENATTSCMSGNFYSMGNLSAGNNSHLESSLELNSNAQDQELLDYSLQSDKLEIPHNVSPAAKLVETYVNASEVEMECCQICLAEKSSQIENASDLLFAPCKHRAMTDNGNFMYSVKDAFFRSQDEETPVLKLINLDNPSGTSELGKSLLQAWDSSDV